MSNNQYCSHGYRGKGCHGNPGEGLKTGSAESSSDGRLLIKEQWYVGKSARLQFGELC